MNWKFWKRDRRPHLTICFKSGRRITLRHVTSWEVRSSRDGESDVVSFLAITQADPTRKLIMKSLCLNSIEAIVEHR